MPSLITAAWAAWGAANLPASGKFAADDLAGAIVKLGIRVPATARTAETLGTEREGTGVLIDDAGHILTIGYLLLEAESILVVTADGRVLPGGTAFISDVGMTGARDSVLGVKKEQAIERMRTEMPVRFESATDDVWVMGAAIEVNAQGLADSIEPFMVPAVDG